MGKSGDILIARDGDTSPASAARSHAVDAVRALQRPALRMGNKSLPGRPATHQGSCTFLPRPPSFLLGTPTAHTGNHHGDTHKIDLENAKSTRETQVTTAIDASTTPAAASNTVTTISAVPVSAAKTSATTADPAAPKETGREASGKNED
ncbi:MAG: hypothetical protein SEPTF4163_000592 [Sporothrix epigloea]